MTRRGETQSVSEAFRDQRADYGAAKPSRFRRRRNLPVAGAGADYHIRNQAHFLALVEFARDMEHNAPLVRQGVRRLVANCNPGSMTPDPDTTDTDVDAHLMRRWKDWSKDPAKTHAAGKLSFQRLTNVGFGRVVIDGDFFALPLESGKLQTLEAERCRTPNRARTRGGVCGVEKDDAGCVSRYWFTARPLDGRQTIKFDDVQPFEAYTPDGEPNVFHVYNPERFSQSRGITAVAPVLDVEGMRDDNEFATLVKSQTQACQTFAETVDPSAWAHLDMLGAFEKLKSNNGEYFLDQWENGNDRKTVGIRPGQILRPRIPGTKYELLAADIPGDGFFQLERMLLSYLAINLDLPLIILLLDASDTTFSSYRHVLDQARTTYREILDWFSMQWHRPIWRWKVMQWLESGDEVLMQFVRSHGDEAAAIEMLLQHDWHGRGERYIDPVKDKTGDAIELSHSLTSRRRWSRWRHGVDWETLAGEIIGDNAIAVQMAIEAAQDLTQQTGVSVDWRDLLPFGMPTGVKLSLTDDDGKGDKPSNPTGGQPAEGATGSQASIQQRMNGDLSHAT